MSITDPKNPNDPNSLSYYAPRRPRDRMQTDRMQSLRAAQLQPPETGRSVRNVSIQPPDAPVPAWYDPRESSFENPFPESLRSIENEAIESLRELNHRARRAEIVALAGRFTVVGCIAAAIAFGYVFYFTDSFNRTADQDSDTAAPAVRADKLVLDHVRPAAANTFAAADPTTSRPLPLNVKTEEPPHDKAAALKVLPADTKSTFGAAPAAEHSTVSAEPPVKVIPTVAVPRAESDSEAPRQIQPDVLAAMMSRAEQLLSSGDVPAARLLLQRAAEAHNARAAFELAATYDPTVMKTVGNIGPRPDIALARSWYQKARDWGSPDAGKQLDALASAAK
ncbi:MAG TPA: hypothetical protein VFX37_01425 [Pseudolabrys sp.]|nr:hypothetical protein [Pseudolabrys sp.]